MNTVWLWLIRYGHVLSGAVWAGGYALLALVIIPMLRNNRHEALLQLSINAVRVMTYAGMATIFFGLLLIMRTRGYGSLLRGEWGMLILLSVGIAIALLGIGDGALRPALRRLGETGEGSAAQRFALIGLILTALAIGLMTRALYAGS